MHVCARVYVYSILLHRNEKLESIPWLGSECVCLREGGLFGVSDVHLISFAGFQPSPRNPTAAQIPALVYRPWRWVFNMLKTPAATRPTPLCGYRHNGALGPLARPCSCEEALLSPSRAELPHRPKERAAVCLLVCRHSRQGEVGWEAGHHFLATKRGRLTTGTMRKALVESPSCFLIKAREKNTTVHFTDCQIVNKLID